LNGQEYLRQKHAQLDLGVCDEVDGKLVIKAEYQQLGCPYCQTSDGLPYRNDYLTKGLTYSRCRTCSLVYPSPRLNQTALDIRVDSEATNKYYEWRHQAQPAAVDLPRPPARREFRRELKYLEQFYPLNQVRSPKVLEVGCADGAFLSELARHECQVTGVEPNRASANTARQRGLEIVPELFKPRVSLGSATFDLVVMRETLYHFFDVRQALVQSRDLLRTGGTLYIKCFNVDSFAIRHFASASGGINGLDIPCNFSPKAIKYILEDAGFEVLGFLRFPEAPLGDYLLKWDILRHPLFRYPRGVLNRAISGWLMPLGQSRNFAVTARKSTA